MSECAFHASSPVGQGVDDIPGGEVEREALETGAVLKDDHLPRSKGGTYSQMVEPVLVDEVGEEWREDLDCADKAAQVCGRAESVCEIVQEGGADQIGGGLKYGSSVEGDALDVHDEVVVGCEGGKGGHDILGALCMAGRVFDACVEGRNGPSEKGAADERRGDEIRPVQLPKN